jgi:nucleoside-diphosphate-sugar epimerase
MRVLLIGGGGLLGTHLTPKLLAAGHEVAICDNMSGCPRVFTDEGVRLFTPNVADENSTRQAFSVFKPEIIIFAAAHYFARNVIYSFFDDVRLILDSANVVSSLITKEIKHVYFCSTSEVYGGPQTNRPLKESRKIDLSTTHHGTAKLAAEKVLAFRCNELGIGCTTLRIFDMFGPRKMFCPRTGMLSFLIDSFAKGETIGLTGATRLRDFIHVEDVASTMMSLLGTKFSGTLNLGTGKGVSLIQLVKGLATVMQIQQHPLVIPDGPVKSLSAVADMSALREVLPGWEPTLDVFSCLAELVSFHTQPTKTTT